MLVALGSDHHTKNSSSSTTSPSERVQSGSLAGNLHEGFLTSEETLGLNHEFVIMVFSLPESESHRGEPKLP